MSPIKSSNQNVANEGRNLKKMTKPFAHKLFDADNERLINLEDKIRHKLKNISPGTPGPGLYNPDLYTIDKKLQQSMPFASLRSNHESGSTGTFDLID